MGSNVAERPGSSAQSMDAGGSVRMIIELYCGSCAFVRYIHSQLELCAHQDRATEVWYMCVDCLSRKEIEQKYVRWDLASFLRKDWVVYIQRDLRKVSPARLELWCQAATRREQVIFMAVQACFDCTTLSQAGACNNQEVRTHGGGAVSLPAQYDSRHLKALCLTLRYLARVAPRALLSVENPWARYFKEHRLIQELIEEGIFFLYRTDFCAAATLMARYGNQQLEAWWMGYSPKSPQRCRYEGLTRKKFRRHAASGRNAAWSSQALNPMRGRFRVNRRATLRDRLNDRWPQLR